MVKITINATFLNCESTSNARMAFVGRELRFPTIDAFRRDSEIAPTEGM